MCRLTALFPTPVRTPQTAITGFLLASSVCMHTPLGISCSEGTSLTRTRGAVLVSADLLRREEQEVAAARQAARGDVSHLGVGEIAVRQLSHVNVVFLDDFFQLAFRHDRDPIWVVGA